MGDGRAAPRAVHAGGAQAPADVARVWGGEEAGSTTQARACWAPGPELRGDVGTSGERIVRDAPHPAVAPPKPR